MGKSILDRIMRGDEVGEQTISFTSADGWWRKLKSKHDNIGDKWAAIRKAGEEHQPGAVVEALILSCMADQDELLTEIFSAGSFVNRIFDMAVSAQADKQAHDEMRALQNEAIAAKMEREKKAEASKLKNTEAKGERREALSPTPSNSAPPPAKLKEPSNLEEWKAQNPDAKPWKVADMTRKFKKLAKKNKA